MEKTSKHEAIIKRIEELEDINECMHYYLYSSTVNQLSTEALIKYFADDNNQEYVLMFDDNFIIRIKNAGQYLCNKVDGNLSIIRMQISSIFIDGVKVYEPHSNIDGCGCIIL